MSSARVTVIIPTCDRPELLKRAIASARLQGELVRVLVVDDASRLPVAVDASSGVAVLRLPKRSGGSAARNTGAQAATTQYITLLDDDDELMPHAIERLLSAIETSTLPAPVCVVGAVEEVDQDNRVVTRRLPPSMPRGLHYQLESAPAGTSYHCKQSLLIEREVFLAIGGFDVAFRSRVHTELFLRLNAVCSVAGIADTTYRLHKHTGVRVSTNRKLRTESFRQLERKHRALLQAHPEGYAKLLWQHGRLCLRDGMWLTGVWAYLRSLQLRRRASPLSPG